MAVPYVFIAAGHAGPTASDIINRAGKRAKILADEAIFTSSEAADALQLLNDMMHGFPAKGIQYAHVQLAATETVNIPDEQIRNLVLMFTRELLIDFQMPLDPLLGEEIEQAQRELQAAYYTVPQARISRSLLPARYGFFDIVRGG